MSDKNQNILNILNRQAESGQFSHAYLFVGPKGSGKKAMAAGFAKKLLGSENLAVHPDYAELDCQTEASAEAVREFIARVAMKPFVSKIKFALLNQVGNLGVQGANALLKTLEEPPSNTVIVLTADTRKVLPTIFSRCQVFNFNPPSLKLRRASRGQADSDLSIFDFVGKSLSERLLGINTFSDLEEPDLKQSIEDFIYESALALSSSPQKYAQLAAGLKAYEDLDTNKNKKLILQGLMLKL